MDQLSSSALMHYAIMKWLPFSLLFAITLLGIDAQGMLHVLLWIV